MFNKIKKGITIIQMIIKEINKEIIIKNNISKMIIIDSGFKKIKEEFKIGIMYDSIQISKLIINIKII